MKPKGQLLLIALALAIAIRAAIGQPALLSLAPNTAPVASKTFNPHPTTIRPSAQLIAKPKHPPAPPKYLCIVRGPGPYDDYANVATVLETSTNLMDKSGWRVAQIGATNAFTETNNWNHAFYRMKYQLK